MKKIKFLSLFVFMTFLMPLLVQSAETSDNTPDVNVISTTVTPKWKARMDSYFYDFQGERPHENDLYEFGDTTLKMQMMSLTYQISSQWTLMMLAQHYENFVVTKIGGVSYKDSSRGLADTIFSGIHTRVLSPSLFVMTDVGVSLPTGSIDEKNPLDPTGETRYPYNMQLGSGTVDALAGVTTLLMQPSFQVGGRLSSILRTSGYNKNGYRLGHQYKADAWVDIPIGATGLAPRLVGYYKHRNGIRGQDKSLRSPAQRTFLEYYYHDQINWDVSAALRFTKSFSPTFSLTAEAGVPLAQDCINYDDVAIYTQYYGTLGLAGSF